MSRVDLAALEAARDKLDLSPTALRAFVDAAYDAVPGLVAVYRAAEHVSAVFALWEPKGEGHARRREAIATLRAALSGLDNPEQSEAGDKR